MNALFLNEICLRSVLAIGWCQKIVWANSASFQYLLEYSHMDTIKIAVGSKELV